MIIEHGERERENDDGGDTTLVKVSNQLLMMGQRESKRGRENGCIN